MAIVKTVTTTTSLALPVRDARVRALHLCAGADAATAEFYDGTVGTIATIAIGAAGTGYTALDVLTLVVAGTGVQATVRVDTVGGSGEITAVTLLTGGTGYTAGSTYATTGGTGSSGTITASTVTHSGTAIGKLGAAANVSAAPLVIEPNIITHTGMSVVITGTTPKAYLYHE